MNVINLKSKEMRIGLIVLNDDLGEGAGTFCFLFFAPAGNTERMFL